MTGPRQGSLAHWLSTFAVGEARFREADTSKPHWRTHPPTSTTRHQGRFSCRFYCAVPMTEASGDPVYLWRVERVE